MFLVDSHTHLEFEDYADDLEQVLERAYERSVRIILSVSCINAKNDGGDLVSLVRGFSGEKVRILSAFGVHPHDAVIWDNRVRDRVFELCKQNSTAALGEIGLDYHYNHSPADTQQEVFIQQIDLAGELELPIIVHSREAEEDTMRILDGHFRNGRYNKSGVVHCYTGSVETAGKILDLGFYLSFGGIVTFEKAEQVLAVIRNVPLERILLETDAPFLAPVPYRGKRNEPSYLNFVVEKIAAIRKIPCEEVARVTTDNFNRLFLYSENAD
ncbi:MAG: TatD family hydrolase [Acidobacteriota bacterium]